MKEAVRRVFLNNMWLKVLSLGLAIVLFWLVRADREVERTVTMNVDVVDKRLAKRTQINSFPTQIRVRVRGRQTQMHRLINLTATYTAEISKLSHNQRYHFDHGLVAKHLGVGVKIIEVIPPSFALRFSPIVTRALPVQPIFRGRVPDGYLRGPAVVTPARILVSGADIYVRQLRFIETSPIELSGATRDVQVDVALQGPTVNFVKYKTPRVTVMIPISAKLGKKPFINVPVKVRNCDPNLRCQPQPAVVDVWLEGPVLAVDALSRSDIERYIYLEASPYTAKQVGEHKAPLIVKNPPLGVKLFTERTYFILVITDTRAKVEPPKVPDVSSPTRDVQTPKRDARTPSRDTARVRDGRQPRDAHQRRVHADTEGSDIDR